MYRERLFQQLLNERKILEITLNKYLALNILFHCGSSGSNIGEGWKEYLQQRQSAYVIALIILIVSSPPLLALNSSGATKE
ncbi:MAG: hypothetical protein Q8R40_02120 [bacterium]|nr:hypothetical protein [bacterium]